MFKKNKLYSLGSLSIFLFFFQFVFQVSAETTYFENIKPVFESRCIACHSCYNAPCQLNLQSYEGFKRGAAKNNIYDGTRLNSVEPSRMFIDAQTTKEWAKKGFHSVSSTDESSQNLFLELLRIRRRNADLSVTKKVSESLTCADNISQTKTLGIENSSLGMPFGFPPLNDTEYTSIEKWITDGAKQHASKVVVKKEVSDQIKEWQDFFNKNTLKNKLASRYMYEHLFLAHIFFQEDQRQFYRLVRSRKACHKDIDEIATRRPSDDPGVKQFYYCLKRDDQPVVLKTHMPMLFDKKRLNFWSDLFFQSQPWDVSQLPGYTEEVSQNPFVIFLDIPTKIKYKFLLNDAQFQVMTFIKGPVCNGTNAVNSIQEQFYVFFMNPDSDAMNDKEFAKKTQNFLTLPGTFGSDVETTKLPSLDTKLNELREEYRKQKLEWYQANKKTGLGIHDIWNGDQVNPNAVLTVFRHNDNAVVVKGAVGDLPKTSFVLDYALFERLVYDLVVSFDVFGNVGHQYLTRAYMDLIRMEAEDNFLLLVSPEKRQFYRKAWYRGLLTKVKLKYISPDIFKNYPTEVKFKVNKSEKRQVIEQLLGGFSNEVRGEADTLNWKSFSVKSMSGPKLNSIEEKLRHIVSIKNDANLPFAQYFPETAYLVVRENGSVKDVYSIIHNREFLNISWIIGEEFRRDSDSDSLTIVKNYLISYPEALYEVDVNSVDQMVKDIRNIKSQSAFDKFTNNYQIKANHSEFWLRWDDLNNYMKKAVNEPEWGYLDLTRYLR